MPPDQPPRWERQRPAWPSVPGIAPGGSGFCGIQKALCIGYSDGLPRFERLHKSPGSANGAGVASVCRGVASVLHRAASGAIFSTTCNIMQDKKQQILHRQHTVGERLRWLRDNNRKSLEAFGASIGYDKSYLSRLEGGRSGNPSQKFIDAICSKHLVSREWLLSGSGEPFQQDAIANATEPTKASCLEDRWQQVFSQQPADAKPEMESLMKTLCLVEGVQLLVREMPADQRLQKYQEVVDSPAITPVAQMFWLLVLTKAMRGVRLTPFGLSLVEAARKEQARQKRPQDAMQK